VDLAPITVTFLPSPSVPLPLPPSLSLSLSLPLSHIIFLWTFPATFIAACEGYTNVRAERTIVQAGHLSFPRFYSRRLRSWIGYPKGAYVIPLAIVRTATSFLPEALFHAISTTELAQNTKGGHATCACTERSHALVCKHCRSYESLPPVCCLPHFLPDFSDLCLPLMRAFIASVRGTRGILPRIQHGGREAL